MITKSFLHQRRRSVGRKGIIKKDITFLLYNDGKHLFLADTGTLGGNIHWKWIRYKDFVARKSLLQFPSLEGVSLRHRGHTHGLAKVEITQYLNKIYGPHKKVEVRRDWQQRLLMFPGSAVMIRTTETEVIFSKVLSF